MLRRFNTKSTYLLILCLLVFCLIPSGCSNYPENDTIDEDLIYQSAQRAVDYLKRLQHDNGQIILDSYIIFNVWETIQAVRAISLWQNRTDLKQDPVIQSALTFLKNSETSSGMVLHNNLQQNSYCIETSSEYIQLLAFLEARNATEQHGAAREKALYMKSKQLPSGAWRIESPEIPEHLQQFPSVTGFALEALASTNTVPLDLDAALQYLRESQNEEGHWGFVWQYYGTPYYAMVPILKSIHYHNTDNFFNDIINKAKIFLLASQNEDGSFSYKSKKNEIGPSLELETILGLRSLLSCNVGCDDIYIKSGINWLLRNQEGDGSWNGGTFPLPHQQNKKKEDIFCTSQVLIFLYEYLNKK